MRDLTSLCDYFVICSGDSERQVAAIYDQVTRLVKKNKIKIQHYTNDKSSRWMLVDLFDVIVHVFIEEARTFYNLEYLWTAAKKIYPAEE